MENSSDNASSPSGPVWSMLRRKQLIPTCCAKHIVPCYISKAVDISAWNFPVPEERFTLLSDDGIESQKEQDDDIESQKEQVDSVQQIAAKKPGVNKIGRYSKLTKLHQQRLIEMKDFEHHLEQCKIDGFLRQFQSSLDPAIVEKVAHLLDIHLPPPNVGETEEEHEAETATLHSSPPLSVQMSEESTAPVEPEQHSSQSSPSTESGPQNPYKSLLKRLAQEEYEKKYPDKDKVMAKALEEHVQKVTTGFSNWTTTIGIQEGSRQPEEEQVPIIEAKTLQKMFKVKYGQTPMCPHIPVGVKEPKADPRKPPAESDALKKHKEKELEEVANRRRYNVKWYLDPNLWFQDWRKDDIKLKVASKGRGISPSTTNVSYKDSQLLNLRGVQAFMRYLSENNLTPPPFLSSDTTE